MRPRTSRMSNEPLNAGGRELGLKARPPARFSSQPSPERVNQKQVPAGNTLLAQRYLLPGNSYFWHAAMLPATRRSARHLLDGSPGVSPHRRGFRIPDGRHLTPSLSPGRRGSSSRPGGPRTTRRDMRYGRAARVPIQGRGAPLTLSGSADAGGQAGDCRGGRNDDLHGDAVVPHPDQPPFLSFHSQLVRCANCWKSCTQSVRHHRFAVNRLT